MVAKVETRLTSSIVDSEEDIVDKPDHDVLAKALVSPSVKGRFLYVVPGDGLELDLAYFTESANTAKLIKFLRRTSLTDISLKVLSVHFANLQKDAHICGKVVYN